MRLVIPCDCSLDPFFFLMLSQTYEDREKEGMFIFGVFQIKNVLPYFLAVMHSERQAF